MKNIQFKISLFALLFLVHSTAFSQLVTFSGTGNLLIPPGAPGLTVGVTQSAATVSGVGTIGGCVTIDNVTINLNHTFDSDLALFLIGPGGQVLELSTTNGGSGDNYNNTVFRDNAATFITAGAPPYTGTFRPEGRITNLVNPFSNVPALGTRTFASTYNGAGADGDWILYINDYVAIDVGLLISWSITFNIGGTPPVANAGPDVAICAGQSKVLTATGGGVYQWSTGSAVATTTVSPAVTTTYTVTVSIPGCATATDDVIVNVSPAPTPTAMAANPTICPGTTTSLTVQGMYTNYQWSNGMNGNPITVANAATYTVTVTEVGGCTGTTSVTVTALPFTAPTITGAAALCPGASLTLTAQGPNYTGYNWSTGDMTQTTLINTTGIYTVTVTNNNSCTGTTSVNINAGAVPTANINGPAALCPGASGTLTATGGTAGYSWSTGSVAASLPINMAGTYTVTVTNNAGCTDSATRIVTANPTPAVSFSVADPDVCAGACTTVTANFTGTPPFTLTYSSPVSGVVVQSFPGNTGTFQICTLTGTTPGNLVVQATKLVDALCTCQ